MHELEQLERDLQNAGVPVVLDVWAPWCLPCRTMEPVIEQMAVEYQGIVEVRKINADQQPQLVKALGVLGIPTLIVYHKGQEVMRHTGALDARGLRSIFEAAQSGLSQEMQIARNDRMIRLVVALGFLVLAMMSNPPWLWLMLSALAFFSAVYDRCPLVQGIRKRLRKPSR